MSKYTNAPNWYGFHWKKIIKLFHTPAILSKPDVLLPLPPTEAEIFTDVRGN